MVVVLRRRLCRAGASLLWAGYSRPALPRRAIADPWSAYGQLPGGGHSRPLLPRHHRSLARLPSAEFLRHEMLRQLPVFEQPPGRGDRHPVGLILVPAGHARMGPDHAGAFLVQQMVVGVVDVLADFQRAVALLDHLPQRLADVADLAFVVEDDAAAMRQVGVGP